MKTSYLIAIATVVLGDEFPLPFLPAQGFAFVEGLFRVVDWRCAAGCVISRIIAKASLLLGSHFLGNKLVVLALTYAAGWVVKALLLLASLG